MKHNFVVALREFSVPVGLSIRTVQGMKPPENDILNPEKYLFF